MENKRKDQILAQLQPLRGELRELTLKIHDNPELGHQEEKACGWQAELLRRHGFEVETGFCGLATAYRAAYKGKKPGPRLAMLAEYDALPQLGHGCGHNLIAMVAVGAGILIQPLVDELGGEIDVIGTPAEETSGAKVSMARQRVFEGYDAVMMGHPAQIDAGSFDTMAIRSIQVEYFGKPAHAAAGPENGVNALDAMIAFFSMVNALRQQTRSDARLHGIITNGGSAANVIPDYTSAMYVIRSDRWADVQPLFDRVVACANAAAMGTGCQVKISPADEDFMDTYSNLTLSALACSQMEQLGHTMLQTERKVMPGSSDLGDVSYQCPAIQLSMGMGAPVGDGPYNPHTREFAAQACSETAISLCQDFAAGFAMTAALLLEDPAQLAAVRAEFEKEVLKKG